MLVVVESTLSGSVSGYLNCSVTGCESADSLIAEYCARKVSHAAPHGHSRALSVPFDETKLVIRSESFKSPS